jgi:hypothetical protein
LAGIAIHSKLLTDLMQSSRKSSASARPEIVTKTKRIRGVILADTGLPEVINAASSLKSGLLKPKKKKRKKAKNRVATAAKLVTRAGLETVRKPITEKLTCMKLQFRSGSTTGTNSLRSSTSTFRVSEKKSDRNLSLKSTLTNSWKSMPNVLKRAAPKKVVAAKSNMVINTPNVQDPFEMGAWCKFY